MHGMKKELEATNQVVQAVCEKIGVNQQLFMASQQ